ncbi:BSP-domain-containing protein [Jackrogersella minutella]|nr:BSP-domain-containing protein [Jackrogersella minutella]
MSQFNPETNLFDTENLRIHLALSQGSPSESESTSPMPLPPQTTPVPPPVFMPGMSHRTEAPAPTSSTLPFRPKPNSGADQTKEEEEGSSPQDSSFELPRLRLHIEDISHAGSSIFLSAVNASEVLRSSVRSVHQHLYGSSTAAPPTRSVTLLLRDIDGVAYTTGSDLDRDHKEIHFSLRYINGIAAARRTAEVTGVVVHELVHCYQWTGQGSAPGGLVEGIADWVRLQIGLAPPHWNRDQVPSKWDVGYQGTAYFLQYLEDRFGGGTVRRLNGKLRKEKYSEKAFWTELVGRPVEQLFEDYKATISKGEDEKKTAV